MADTMKATIEDAAKKHLLFQPDTQRMWLEFTSKLGAALKAEVKVERGDQSRPSSRTRFALIVREKAGERRFDCMIKAGTLTIA